MCEQVGKMMESNVSMEDFSRKCWEPCVMFLLTENNLLPEALQYEILRSTC